MIQLVPMTNAEFDTFIETSMQEQADGQVKEGNWHAEDAYERIKAQCDQLLPDGIATPDHFFFKLEEETSKSKVGEFWYTITEQGGKRQFLVMDIRVYEEYRRRGYGTQAFKIMEERAREMGITTIALYVFKHNHPARAMYKKLGYTGAGDMMLKTLETDAE